MEQDDLRAKDIEYVYDIIRSVKPGTMFGVKETDEGVESLAAIARRENLANPANLHFRSSEFLCYLFSRDNSVFNDEHNSV